MTGTGVVLPAGYLGRLVQAAKTASDDARLAVLALRGYAVGRRKFVRADAVLVVALMDAMAAVLEMYGQVVQEQVPADPGTPAGADTPAGGAS